MEVPRRASDVPLPGGDFRMLVTRLSLQAMISLGVIENPLTKKKEPNVGAARALVDDLRMLRAKTEGNLEPDEREYLDKVVGDLARALGNAEG